MTIDEEFRDTPMLMMASRNAFLYYSKPSDDRYVAFANEMATLPYFHHFGDLTNIVREMWRVSQKAKYEELEFYGLRIRTKPWRRDQLGTDYRSLLIVEDGADYLCCFRFGYDLDTAGEPPRVGFVSFAKSKESADHMMAILKMIE